MPSAALHLLSHPPALRSAFRLFSPSPPPPPSFPVHCSSHLHPAFLPLARALGGAKHWLWRPLVVGSGSAEDGRRPGGLGERSEGWQSKQMATGNSNTSRPALRFQWSPPRSAGLHMRATGGVAGDGDGRNGDGGRSGGGGGGGSGNTGSSDGESEHYGFFAWYLKMLERHPVKTKALTSALLNFLGDLFCQLIVEKSDTINLKRISMITVIGLLLVGPTLHFWYLALSKIVITGGSKGAGMRLLLDQFIFAPVFIAVFFASLLTLEGRPSDIAPKLQQDWRSAVITNWKIWIPFQFLNFLIVPQQLQVGAANIIALAWNVYLSFATHTGVAHPVPKESESHED
ncbi:hypothetical protein O6H91_11G036000 [Diphasiastrum complanatum]|uniref:Uncharacterized protein n=2 Tax=Diphasiastrum complanatum TaxID=34168 RepID=A0ACC2C8C3_DIPCM|nr:hypothetical protein O6H91_11G035400 [Diphasiastrum complanatum]KAJ7538147.1 hypothetical protein O6H91_11G036000 [Diphasiastrum complanatum]